MLVSARQLVHPDNNSTSILVLFDDVTDRRREEVQNNILLTETRHRMKNILAMVRALANTTSVEDRSGAEYRDAFLGRFEAVIDAENLALDGNDEADLSSLVEQAMKPAASGQVRVNPGPAIRLKRSQVVPMSLILHELVVNAMKYGALSLPDGVVQLSWSVSPEHEKRVLNLAWREMNGPPVSLPTRSGFGSQLITHSAASLGGMAELNFDPAGLTVDVTAPLD